MQEKVAQEKKELVRVSNELDELIENPTQNRLSIRQKINEFTSHLSNIGGWCDKNAQAYINSMVRELALISLESWRMSLFKDMDMHHFYAIKLKPLLVLANGIQIDFRKYPFRIIGIGFGKFRAFLER